MQQVHDALQQVQHPLRHQFAACLQRLQQATPPGTANGSSTVEGISNERHDSNASASSSSTANVDALDRNSISHQHSGDSNPTFSRPVVSTATAMAAGTTTGASSVEPSSANGAGPSLWHISHGSSSGGRRDGSRQACTSKPPADANRRKTQVHWVPGQKPPPAASRPPSLRATLAEEQDLRAQAAGLLWMPHEWRFGGQSEVVHGMDAAFVEAARSGPGRADSALIARRQTADGITDRDGGSTRAAQLQAPGSPAPPLRGVKPSAGIAGSDTQVGISELAVMQGDEDTEDQGNRGFGTEEEAAIEDTDDWLEPLWLEPEQGLTGSRLDRVEEGIREFDAAIQAGFRHGSSNGSLDPTGRTHDPDLLTHGAVAVRRAAWESTSHRRPASDAHNPHSSSPQPNSGAMQGPNQRSQRPSVAARRAVARLSRPMPDFDEPRLIPKVSLVKEAATLSADSSTGRGGGPQSRVPESAVPRRIVKAATRRKVVSFKNVSSSSGSPRQHQSLRRNVAPVPASSAVLTAGGAHLEASATGQGMSLDVVFPVEDELLSRQG